MAIKRTPSAPVAPGIRPVTAVAAAPVQGGEFADFMSLGNYSGGFTLPEGNWALWFNWGMERAHEKMGGRQPRLGVFLTAVSLADPARVEEQFLSAGRKAADSFTPDTETQGKKLRKVPGGAGSGLPRNTNWMLFLKSMIDAGLPENLPPNDFSVLDGIWVTTANQVPKEAEERKGYGGSATGEAGMDDVKGGDGPIPQVVAILDGGKPWEGTGGMPGAAAVVATPTPKAPVPFRPAAPVARQTPVAAPVAVVEAAGDEDLHTAAVEAVTEVLMAAPDGAPRLTVRTNTRKVAEAKYGAGVAEQIIATFFASDDSLGGILGELGYKLAGPKVIPG